MPPAVAAPAASAAPPSADPAARIRRLWARLHRLPGGKWLFSRLLGLAVPYTGSISPFVDEMRPGFARVVLRDRRPVRNHLSSVHAIALANLAEVASGLALISGLGDDQRGILIGFRIEYLRKARGTLVAECSVSLPPGRMEHDIELDVEVRDGAGAVVVRAHPRWRVGPVRSGTRAAA